MADKKKAIAGRAKTRKTAKPGSPRPKLPDLEPDKDVKGGPASSAAQIPRW